MIGLAVRGVGAQKEGPAETGPSVVSQEDLSVLPDGPPLHTVCFSVHLHLPSFLMISACRPDEAVAAHAYDGHNLCRCRCAFDEQRAARRRGKG